MSYVYHQKLSKTVKDLRSYYVPSKKLADYSFMGTGKRHETSGSEAEDPITHNIARIMNFLSVALDPKYHRVNTEQCRWMTCI